MTATPRRHRLIGNAFCVLVVVEALSFLVFAVLHVGARIPLGFATIGTDRIGDAAIAEGISGALLAVSAYVLVARRSWALGATVFAQVFSLVAVLVGIAAIAAGKGPSSLENDVYHRILAPVLALSLVWLLTPAGRKTIALLSDHTDARRPDLTGWPRPRGSATGSRPIPRPKGGRR
jgi:hypothetical protein